MTKTVAALTLHADGSATLRFMREDGTVALVYCKDRAHADALQFHRLQRRDGGARRLDQRAVRQPRAQTGSTTYGRLRTWVALERIATAWSRSQRGAPGARRALARRGSAPVAPSENRDDDGA